MKQLPAPTTDLYFTRGKHRQRIIERSENEQKPAEQKCFLVILSNVVAANTYSLEYIITFLYCILTTTFPSSYREAAGAGARTPAPT